MGSIGEYIIYADESTKRGQYFSNFYGGALVRSQDLQLVRSSLRTMMASLNLTGEVKWSKVSAAYLNKYMKLMDCFFSFVRGGRVKVRIMFTQNANVPTSLSERHAEDEYFLLYYQFIKHAFGLPYSNDTGRPIQCRLYLDRLPDTREKVAVFRGYLCGLSKAPDFRRALIQFPPEQIAEVRSHDHVILQCLDVVLGSMQFRLNDKHKSKPPGSRVRGNKTIAKEKLYRHINRCIRALYPNFNIGISTGTRNGPKDRWFDPYRHWLFRPREHDRDDSRTKRGQTTKKPRFR